MRIIDYWKGLHSTTRAMAIITLLGIGLLVFGLFSIGLSFDNAISPTSDSMSQNHADTFLAHCKVARVQYDGKWSGEISNDETVKPIVGYSEENILLDDSSSHISVTVQKNDGSDRTLTVEILDAGEVVAESKTNSAYGTAVVNANFWTVTPLSLTPAGDQYIWKLKRRMAEV